MTEYLKAQTKTNEMILNHSFNPDELHRFSTSDYRWADNRMKSNQHRPIKKGEIYQFEFGKNFIPEMSYEHRGMILGIKKKLIYVLPIFSYNFQKHTDVYHPIDFPTSKSDMYLLKSNEFSFISHDSILKLNDIRTVSINRILYKHNGQISPDSDTYQQIESLVLQKYFPDFHYKSKQNIQELSSLYDKFSELEKCHAILKQENRKLQTELEVLKTKTSANLK